MHRATVRQLVGFTAFLAVVLVGLRVVPPPVLFERADSLAARPALAAAVLLALYLVRPLLAWPISALSVLLGYLYGPAAVPIALAGAVVTTLPPYLAARRFGHDAGVLGRVGAAGERVRATVGDFRGVTASRLAPLPTDAVSYAAGLARVPPAPFVAGTAVGESPWVVAAVLVGASAGRVATRGPAADPLLLVGALCAALLVLAGPMYRHLSTGGPATE